MSTVFFLIGIALIYLGKKKSSGQSSTVKQTINNLGNQEVGTAMTTVMKTGFKIYLKIMLIAFGVVFIFMGLIGWLLF